MIYKLSFSRNFSKESQAWVTLVWGLLLPSLPALQTGLFLFSWANKCSSYRSFCLLLGPSFLCSGNSLAGILLGDRVSLHNKCPKPGTHFPSLWQAVWASQDSGLIHQVHSHKALNRNPVSGAQRLQQWTRRGNGSRDADVQHAGSVEAAGQALPARSQGQW